MASREKNSAKKERPSHSILRKLHARLAEASSLEDRKAIYEECGFHPVALARWFRMLELKNVVPLEAAPKSKRGPGRPKGSTSKALHAATKTSRPKTYAPDESKFRIAPGLSLEAREAAIELLRALLAD